MDTGILVLIQIPVYTDICTDIVISFLYRYRPVLIQIPEYRNYTDTGLNEDTKRNTVLKKQTNKQCFDIITAIQPTGHRAAAGGERISTRTS